jgi:hypothetical protein
MGYHPLNLAFRFILELCALIAVGFWGWNQTDSPLKFFLAIGFPIILAFIWGVFAVPNDKSRSGKAPIPTPGLIRLPLELIIFAIATWFIQLRTL